MSFCSCVKTLGFSEDSIANENKEITDIMNNYIASSLFGWLLMNDDEVSSQYANNKNNLKIVSLEVYCFQLIMNAKFLTLTIYVNL